MLGLGLGAYIRSASGLISFSASIFSKYRERVIAAGGVVENDACTIVFLNNIGEDTYNTASLIMYPSGYEAGTIFDLKPTDGSGDLTFTRASTATRVNAEGLIEGARTNLLLQSNTFNTTWALVNVSATGGQAGYDGTNNAWLIDITAGVSAQRIDQTISASGVLTLSVYAKAGTLSWMSLRSDAPAFSEAYFNLATGALGSLVGLAIDSSIESVGSGWYRCSVSFVNTTIVRIYLATGNGDKSQASGNILIQDAQIEAGDIATEYIPTTTTAVSVGITSNVPRIDYTGGGCGKLLLEPQRTNNLSYSQDFANVYWDKSDITFGADGVSPSGLTDADLIITGTANSDQIEKSITLSATNTITQSVFIKRVAGADWVDFLTVRLGFSNSVKVWFNISTGAVGSSLQAGTTSLNSASIENYGNGWLRLIVTTTDSTNNTIFDTRVRTAISNGSDTRFNNSSYYLYGAQLEAGSYPTSYIPTTTTAVTRVAESTSRSGLGLTNSTFVLNFQILSHVAELFDFTKTGGGRMFYIAVNSLGLITFNSVSGGSIGAIGIPIAINTSHKIAFTLNASTSNVSVFINGVKIGTYATDITTFGAFSGLQTFGYAPASKVEQILIFPSVLTDAQCIELTTL